MDTAELLKALFGFLFGAASTYFGLYWKVRKELEAQYDKELRAERLRYYAELWSLTERLAKYSRPGPVTVEVLRRLSAELREWYFKRGGLFMSQRTRDGYFALQDALGKSIDVQGRNDKHELQEPEFEGIRTIGSRLRTAMTVDVGSRKEPLLAEESRA